MLNLALLTLLPLFAQAAPGAQTQILAKRLIALIPEGYSEGVTQEGAPCRVIFHSMPDVNPALVEYARAQVMAEPEGNLIDVEVFFDERGVRTQAIGRSGMAVSYEGRLLSAVRTRKGIYVRAENKRTRLKASCLVQP